MAGRPQGPKQRSLGLPGLRERLTPAEVAEQAQRALELLKAKDPPRRIDPLAAPRRAVAAVRRHDEKPHLSIVRLVCGHELVCGVEELNAGKGQGVHRCLACQAEGRS